MRTYVARRLMLIPFTLFVVSVTVFLLVRIVPGSLVDLMETQLEQQGGEIDRAALEHALGFDVPIHIQYGRWVGNIIMHGDFGNSLVKRQPVAREILRRLPVTLELSFMAILIGISMSIPIGIISAIRQDTLTDYAGRSFAILMLSVPAFWVATLVMIYPSIWWGWSPSMQLITLAEDPLGNLAMFLLPSFIMGTHMTGGTMRMTRTMMLEVLRQDYVRTAWSKGLTERTVVWRHALKNALIPVVTILGMQMPVLIGGTVIIEQIFSLPGMGRLMLDSLRQRDYPMVSGINLIIATFVVTVNLVVDITYAFLDPRVQYK